MLSQPIPVTVAPRVHRRIPPAWLLTDARLGGAMVEIAARMPPRCAILIRPHARGAAEGTPLLTALRRVARAKRHVLLWGGKGRPMGIDGVHVRCGESGRQYATNGRRLFVSRSVHNGREAALAVRRGCDAVLVSPVYPTRSHPGAPTLGKRGFAQLSGRLHGLCGVIALGGMDRRRFARMRHLGCDGWAAIDAWQAADRRRLGGANGGGESGGGAPS